MSAETTPPVVSTGAEWIREHVKVEVRRSIKRCRTQLVAALAQVAPIVRDDPAMAGHDLLLAFSEMASELETIELQVLDIAVAAAELIRAPGTEGES